MKVQVKNFREVEAKPVQMEGAEGCVVRWLVGQPEGAPLFAMRHFEVAPGGFTPRHHHPYEHEVFVLEGTGAVFDGTAERPLAAGDVIYVPPGAIHQFRNTGERALKFLCMVPHMAHAPQVSAAPECGIDR